MIFKKGSLRWGTLHVLVGTSVYAACQWMTVLVLSHMGSVRHVGEYGFGLALTGPAFVFAFMGLRQVLALDRGLSHSFAEYVCSRNLSSVAALLVSWGWVQVTDPGMAPLVLAVGASKLVEANIDIFHGLAQRERRFDVMSASRAASGLLGLAMFTAAFWFTRSTICAVIGMTVGTAVSFLLFDLRPFRRQLAQTGSAAFDARTTLTIARQKALFWLALPLAWAAVLVSLRTNVPRYLVEHYLGIEQVGAFVSIAYLITMFTLVVAAMGRSSAPRLADFAAAGRWSDFRHLLHRVLGLSTMIGFVCILFGWLLSKPAVMLIYGEQTAEYHSLLGYVMVVAWMTTYCSAIHHGLEAVHFYKTHLLSSAVSTFICFVACLAALQLGGGLAGVALAWAVSLGVQAAWGYLALRRNWHDKQPAGAARTP